MAVTDKVLRDDGVLGVAENALELVLGSALEFSLDLIVRGRLLEACRQVNNGDVRRWHSECHTGELAVERRNDLADGLGGTSGGGNDVRRRSTASTPVLGRRAVDGLLRGSGCVNGRHEGLDDAKLVVDDLGKGCETVGGARGVRNDLHFGVVCVKVDTADEHRRIGRGGRDDDFLGATFQVSRGLVDGGEDTSRFDDVVSAGLAPRDRSRVTFGEDGNLAAVDDELAILGGDVLLESSVSRVVLEHVDHVLKVDEGVVDGNHLRILVQDGITEDNATDTAETAHKSGGSDPFAQVSTLIMTHSPVDTDFDVAAHFG